MPRHNTFHVNMLLMPQRHDLLVQLLYPTYKRTHTDTRKLLIIIVTPNRKTIYWHIVKMSTTFSHK